MYAKGDEMKVKGHRPHRSVYSPDLQAWADNKLRVEVVLRAIELKRIEKSHVSNWTRSTPAEVHAEKLRGLNMSEQIRLNATDLEGLSPRLVLAYHSWRDGYDLRTHLPHRTFYRYRKELLERGIDIAIKQNRNEHSNVVPLLRVLEATPASIPDWGMNPRLYFEPSVRAL